MQSATVTPESILAYYGIHTRSNRFSKEQLSELTASFEENPYPTSTKKQELSEKTGLTIGQIENWLWKKRGKMKKMVKSDRWFRSTNRLIFHKSLLLFVVGFIFIRCISLHHVKTTPQPSLEAASTFYGISLELLKEATSYTLDDVGEKTSPKYKLFNHLQYSFAKSIASICPYNEWRGPLINEFFSAHFQEWFLLFRRMQSVDETKVRAAKSLIRRLAHSHYNILLKRVVTQKLKSKEIGASANAANSVNLLPISPSRYESITFEWFLI